MSARAAAKSGAKFERVAQFERGVIDLKTGEFPLTLATDGEASDGHIIAIDGLAQKARTTMLFNHRSEIQIPALGTITNPHKDQKGGVNRQRGTGRIKMEGDSMLGEIRREIAGLIGDGAIEGMSVRWEATNAPIRRTELPPEHPAHVTADEQGEKRWGLFFPKSRVLEGSVVAVGADPKALAGRSQAASSDGARIFFRVLAEAARESDEGHADMAMGLALLRDQAAELREAGACEADLVNALSFDVDADIQPLVYGDGGVLYVPRDALEEFRAAEVDDLRAALRLALEQAEPATAPEPTRATKVQPEEPAPAPAPRGPKTVGEMPAREFLAGLGDTISAGLGRATRDLRGRLD